VRRHRETVTGVSPTTRADGRRSDVLRQAGLVALCAGTEPRSASPIALVDGAVDTAHPAFRGCAIFTIGERAGGAAAAHATFNASVLVASRADRAAGRALGIASGCAVVNVAAVTDRMLTTMPPDEVAATLSAAVREGTRHGCRVLLFGVEIRRPESREWAPLREALRATAGSGGIAIVPAGNRAASHSLAMCWPGVLVVASHGRRGGWSAFSPIRARGGVIVAPGEEIPGAAVESSYDVRSGTSFAAAVTAAAIARAAAGAPGRALIDVAVSLCPPPSRVLNAGRFAAGPPSCLEEEDPHATAHA
jgi:hypothetical protein